MTDLPDINVWLAFTVEDHPHHARALHYWKTEAADTVAFCRVTALGFIRLSTNRPAMQGQPFTVPEAWKAYWDLRQLPEVVLADEPEGCELSLGSWAATNRFTAKQITDAYLAAFAARAGFRVVSFDNDFSRFGEADFLRLQP